MVLRNGGSHTFGYRSTIRVSDRHKGSRSISTSRTTPSPRQGGNPGKPSGSDRLTVLRDLVIQAGLEVLDQHGLGLQADSITYAKVFSYLEEEHGVRVTRGSVHDRIWRSQDDFRKEVLLTAAEQMSPYRDGESIQLAIVSVLQSIDRHGLVGRDRVQAFCRMTGVTLLSVYLEVEWFRQFQMLKAAARSDDESTAALKERLQKNSQVNTDDGLRRLTFLFEALGLRPRPEFGERSIDVFIVLVQALVSGVHLDHHAGFRTASSKVETDLPYMGEGAPWTYFGLGMLAYVEFLYELDPSFDPATYAYPIPEKAPRLPKSDPLDDLADLVNPRPRRSREELRRMVVAAGVELLIRDGLGLEAESLSYSTVFAHIKKTRGISLHRSTVHPAIWASQDEFRSDILAESARHDDGEWLLSMKQAMAAQKVTRNSDGSVNVRQLVNDNLRAMNAAQLSNALVSPAFNRWQSIKGALLPGSSDDATEAVRHAVRQHYEGLLERLGELYRSVLPLVGLTVNPDLAMTEDHAYRVLSVLCAAQATGVEFNISAGTQMEPREISLPRVDGSGLQEDWNVQAVGSRAVLELLFTSVDAPDSD